MCFYIERSNPKALIAKKDVKVAKVLILAGISNKKLESPCYSDFYWKPNKLFKSELREVLFFKKNEPQIGRGLHSFIDRKEAYDKGWWFGGKKVICECIVPEGSTYYINKKRGEIVSTQMMWTGRVWSFSSKRWVKFGCKLEN
jgi:hypothetical protein